MGHGAPSGETPQQKIARLRAAAAMARTGKESTFDSVVRVGRKWADRAHRVTAYSLIGLTGTRSAFPLSWAIGGRRLEEGEDEITESWRSPGNDENAC